MTTIKDWEIEENIILFCRGGSYAYGLNTPESDEDYKGICVAPKRFYTSFETFEQKDKWDSNITHYIYPELDNNDAVIYEVRRFLRLLQSQNPNILEMLWQEPEDYLYINHLGGKLIDAKEQLISKKISSTFVEYGRAQVKKMLTHRKWLLNPPSKPPEWSDYGIDVEPFSSTQIESFIEFLYWLIKDRIEYYRSSTELFELINRIDWKAALKQHVLPEECISTVQMMTRASDDYMQILRASQQYRADRKRWENYQDWLKNRNEKRSAIEKLCGYDGKNASHCVRLVTMANEALKTGKLIVNRQHAGDAKFLLDIKQGRIPYEEVDSIITDLFEESKILGETSSVLPSKIDCDFVNNLCIELIEESGVLN